MINLCYVWMKCNNDIVLKLLCILCVFVVVVLADNRNIASMLNQHGFHVQSIEETGPIQVYPASVLSKIFSYLGNSCLMDTFVDL